MLIEAEGGGGGNGMSNFIFSPTPPSPPFYFAPAPLASQNYFTYYELKRNDYGQLIDRSLIPKVHAYVIKILIDAIFIAFIL